MGFLLSGDLLISAYLGLAGGFAIAVASTYNGWKQADKSNAPRPGAETGRKASSKGGRQGFRLGMVAAVLFVGLIIVNWILPLLVSTRDRTLYSLLVLVGAGGVAWCLSPRNFGGR
jgi:hypothetical protein